jgi:hypothetical protein
LSKADRASDNSLVGVGKEEEEEEELALFAGIVIASDYPLNLSLKQNALKN